MTTVAYDAKTRVLAADSRCFDGEAEFPTRKIWQLKDGRIFGACGDGGFTEAARDWIEAGMPRDAKPDFLDLRDDPPSFSGLLVDLEGRIWHFDEYLEPMEVLRQYHAIGTGARLAAKLIENGKTALEALELIVSLELDEHSGGPVQQLQLPLPHEVTHGKARH
jgi:hypothetical protein